MSIIKTKKYLSRELGGANSAIRVVLIFFVLVIVCVLLLVVSGQLFDNDRNEGDSVRIDDSPEESAPSKNDPLVPSNEQEPQQSDPDNLEPDEDDSLPTNLTMYRVIYVVDGDTIHIETSQGKEKVRLIGINTPEVGDYGGVAECYGDVAKTYATNRLLNNNVGIELDSGRSSRDSYGRLLAYVWIDGKNFNKEMIEKGLACENSFGDPYKYSNEFINAEKGAINAGLGIWGGIADCRVSAKVI
jgi:micrococcal nuclease